MDEKVFDMEMRGRELPFSVPEGYFERFAEEMERSRAPQKRPVWALARPIFTAAAVFAGLIAVSYLVFTLQRGIVPQTDDYMPVRQEYAEIIADQFDVLQLEDILSGEEE